MGHLGTLCEVLDNIPAGMNFLTENIYNRLNRANSRFIKGTQDQTKKLDMLAASLGKIKEKVRFKGERIRDLSYKDIKSMIYKAAPMKNVKIKETIPVGDNKFKTITIKSLDANEQMRIYALYKNKDQRAKLINQGIDQQFIENIEMNLGPTLVKFADLVVDYLSNEHYERVNNVHREVNNINMKKIENYFPTRTQSSTITKDANLIDSSTDSMVGNRFSSVYASFLKERTDRKSDVAIKSDYGTFDFTSELENHLGESERFVAYASDVKTINSIMMNGSVVSLLKTNGLYDTFFTLLNNAIMRVSNSTNGLTRYMLSAFVGKQIGFKPMQFLKQEFVFYFVFP